MKTSTLATMARRAKYLVILDTMWGPVTQKAARWFPINPHNHSGKRLYRLTQSVFPEIWVTNACPLQTNHATKHSIPSADWLNESLDLLPAPCRYVQLLVCGRVAQETFRLVTYRHGGPVLELMHPAARMWSQAKINAAIHHIAHGDMRGGLCLLSTCALHYAVK